MHRCPQGSEWVAPLTIGRRSLRAEHGAGAVRARRAIKQALDPDNIMNPGKIVPLDGG
jgi:FAD/FMN-containing dehydrogenase